MLKAKFPLKRLAENKETFYVAKSRGFAGVQTALNAFKELAGLTAVPGLQEGVKALVIVLDAVQVRLVASVGSCRQLTSYAVVVENVAKRRRCRILHYANRDADGDLERGDRRRRFAIEADA